MDNYFGSYNATVIDKILAQDGIILGITNMDEFAAGSSTETSCFGPTQNPAALEESLEDPVEEVLLQ